jgi:hypothetical protein
MLVAFSSSADDSGFGMSAKTGRAHNLQPLPPISMPSDTRPKELFGFGSSSARDFGFAKRGPSPGTSILQVQIRCCLLVVFHPF